MDFSAAHSDVVIASYVLTGACLVTLTIILILRDRKLAKKLKALNKD